MATIHVDGKQFEVKGSDNLLAACLSLGLDIPYFCWHPALGSVGSCRQCAVKQYADENDTRGRIVMSCMVAATDNTWIAIEDEEAKKFRQSVVEWIMTNHPHDCPVCEEGGHCHLQDMTVMVGQSKRKYRFHKRSHINQDLGPFINHEMNRCIACYRCVRFYKDYAGGTDLGVYGAHDNVYFGRVADGILESEFSGNLTEICPTGVFTDKTHSEHYARKWDMQFSPSICQGCSSGCNISPGERYGEIRRIENRFNGAINHYFLCDRGRFGYDYVNDKNRPRQPIYKNKLLSLNDAIDFTGSKLKNLKLLGIGSARTSLENNHALCRLVGRDNFSAGFTSHNLTIMQLISHVLLNSPLPTASIRDIEQHDAIFVLGEDLTQTAARIALAVRAAVKQKGVQLAEKLGVPEWQNSAVKTISQKDLHPLFIASLTNTKLDDIAQSCFYGSPEKLAQLGFAIAHLLDEHAPNPHNLSSDMRKLAEIISQSLLKSKKPLIISGASLGSTAIIEATANIIKSLHSKNKNGSISIVMQEANSLGMALYGGKCVEDILSKADENSALIILERDLYRDLSIEVVNKAFAAAKLVLVLDHQNTSTTSKANILLPAASFAEGAQRYFQVYDPSYYDENCIIHDSWRWLHSLETSLHNNATVNFTQIDQITADCASVNINLSSIVHAAPESSFRIKGLKIARKPLRYSGRTAMLSNKNVHEPRQPQDHNSSLSFSMEGYSSTQELREQIPFAWSPGWNSPQAWNKFQNEVGLHLKAGDQGVRLIEPISDNLSWFVPNFNLEEYRWQFVPIYHLFGSEENTAKSAAFKKVIPNTYIMLNKNEASKLQAQAGDDIVVNLISTNFVFPLLINDSLNDGLIGLPFGFNSINNDIFNQKVIDITKG